MKKAFTGRATIAAELAGERKDVEFRLWEGYGKKRIYFEANSTRAQTAIKGYIDCNNGNEIIYISVRFPKLKEAVNTFMAEYEF